MRTRDLLFAVALVSARSEAHATDLTDVWQALKEIPVAGGTAFIDLGGELRERGEYYSAPEFGLAGASETYLLHRLLLSVDLHVGDNFRAFVQLGNHIETGKNKPLSPTDQDRGDVQQAYVELNLAASNKAVLTVGRQELSFGSQRLVSVREPLNVRRSFDGFRTTITLGNVVTDLFAVRPVQLKQGYFDDTPDRNQSFWGAYSTVTLSRSAALDIYYLDFRNNLARYGGVLGAETRHSFGTRFFGKASGWDWNIELVGQFGDFAQERIRAWTVASDNGYTFTDLFSAPRIGLKANIASGDHNRADRTLQTFNPLFPKFGYFTEADLISPNNFYDFQPSLTLTPANDLNLSMGWDFVWRESLQDAIYFPPGIAVPRTAGMHGRFTGDQVALDVTWQPARHVEAKASYVHFWPGDGLKTINAREVDFVMTSVAYKF